MEISVTEAELLDAIATAQRAESGGQTVTEIVEATGVHRRKVLSALHAFQRQGRLQVQQAYRMALNGKSMPVPVYTITPAKAKRGR